MSDAEDSLEEKLRKFRLWKEASADGSASFNVNESAGTSHSNDYNQDKPNQSMGRDYPEKPPSHLRGRELGMYYRNKARRNNQQHSQDSDTTASQSGHWRNERHKGLQRRKAQERSSYEANEPGSSNRFRRFQDQRDINLEEQAEAPPPGLRGRELGLFYRDRQTAKTKQREKRNAVDITLPRWQIQEIRNTLQINRGFEQSDIYREFVENENIRSVFKNEYLRVISKTLQETLREESAKMDGNSSTGSFALHDDGESRLDGATKPLDKFRQSLPAFQQRETILDMVERHQVILIKGDTGCGKTTQVPQYILERAAANSRAGSCRILCTQPRRISAITLARRVADERNEVLGQSVGYQIRLEAVRPNAAGGRILFCTTGIVLMLMQSDPLLRDYSHLVLDEIHERDVITDLLLAIIRMVLPYRKDLRVILMSATLTAETFSQYFNNCPMVEIHGIAYPVREHYLEDVLSDLKFYSFEDKMAQGRMRNRHQTQQRQTAFDDMIKPYCEEIASHYPAAALRALQNPGSENNQNQLIVELLYYITCSKPPGAILVFLPSLAQISDVNKLIRDHRMLAQARLLVFPLHSHLPTRDQTVVFERPPEGVRKIILSTNIAETSITIDDIVYVVNAGRHKLNRYDNGVSVLRDEWISVSNEIQRKGRAGRVQEGVCYHLYSRARRRTFLENVPPEIIRVALDEVILQTKILQLGETRAFMEHLLDKPTDEVIEESLQLLNRLNAIDNDQKLTPLGYHLARLPMDPRTGKMVLLASIFSCIDPITSIAASLTFKNAFYKPLGKEKEVDRIKRNFAQDSASDHIMLANVIAEWRKQSNKGGFCGKHFLNGATLQQLTNMKGQFCEYLYATKFVAGSRADSRQDNLHSDNIELLRAIVGAGLYPNVAFIRRVIRSRNSPDGRAILNIENQGRAEIHPGSVNGNRGVFHSNFVVYYDMQKLSSLTIFDTTVVNPFPLLFFGDNHVETVDGREIISIAGHYCLKCDKETYDLIQDLRAGFNLFLQKQICNPSPVDWNSREGELLRFVFQKFVLEMVILLLVLLTFGGTVVRANPQPESLWKSEVARELAPDALLVRLDRLVNVCVANYEDLTTDLLLGIAIANAQLRTILKQSLQEQQRQFVESLAKKCDFVESRIESIFSFPSSANAVVSKLLIDSEFWQSKDGLNVAEPDRVRSRRSRRRRSQPLTDDPQTMMESYLEAIDAGGPSELQSDECLSELLVNESENEFNSTANPTNSGTSAKRLILSRECTGAMSLRKRSYGYHLTHKLLFYIVLGRQRFANVDRSFVADGQRTLCEQILRESELIAGFDYPDLFRDLFMEQVFLCAYSDGPLPEFTNPSWLAAIVSWQNGEGCFKYYADEGDGAIGPRALTTHCSTHMTGVGAALLGLFARLQLVQ
uniref:RNA helicase n=1 Tax=Anopheles minimus TaxID=112268 RepID=A0A182W6T2_9DIPT